MPVCCSSSSSTLDQTLPGLSQLLGVSLTPNPNRLITACEAVVATGQDRTGGGARLGQVGVVAGVRTLLSVWTLALPDATNKDLKGLQHNNNSKLSSASSRIVQPKNWLWLGVLLMCLVFHIEITHLLLFSTRLPSVTRHFDA